MGGSALVGGDPVKPGEGDALFSRLPLSGTGKRKNHKRTIYTSLVLHIGVIAAIVLVPLLQPLELPETKDYIKILIYNPPPAAAASIIKGSSLVRTETKKKVAPDKVEKPKEPEKKPEFVAPIEVPKELPKEERVAAKEVYGSEKGSDLGIAEGMEEGVDEGVAGGTPGGVVGGCVGCTGDGQPVGDYDQGPRLLKKTDPKIPQEAFVKKIEGLVPVDILIDANGKVVKAKVLKSIPALDAAAIECVTQWLFVPAMKRGKAVAAQAIVNVRFSIL